MIMASVEFSIEATTPRRAMPRPPRGPGDADEDELPMGDPPDDDESDDPSDEDEGEREEPPLHTRPH